MTLTAPQRAAVQQQVLRQRTAAPPKTPRLFSVWVGADIPAHYLSVEQLAQAAVDLVPAGKWDGVEVLLKAGEGGSWIARLLHPTWGDPSHLALDGPTTLASHIEVAKALGVRIVPYVVVRAQPAWIPSEQAMVRDCVRVAGRCVLNVEPGTAYYNGPTDPGFIRGYLAGMGVPASALEVCLIPRFTQVAELGGIGCLQAWTDPALVGRASWETYDAVAGGFGVDSLRPDVAIPRLDGWGVSADLSYRVCVVQRSRIEAWGGTIWAAQGLAAWHLDGDV